MTWQTYMREPIDSPAARSDQPKPSRYPDGFNALNRRLPLALCVLLASWCLSLSAAQKLFNLNGVTVSLEDVTSDLGVYYQSMRFNRATRIWNVEVILTNQSARVFNGPFILLVESYSGTTGPLQPDGLDNSAPAKPFYDLSGTVTNALFFPGDRSFPRTISLGFTNGAPSLVTKVYMKAALAAVPLGL